MGELVTEMAAQRKWLGLAERISVTGGEPF